MTLAQSRGRARRPLAIVVVLAVVLTGIGVWVFVLRDGSSISDSNGTAFSPTSFMSDACRLPPEWVRLIHRGWDPGPSRDHDLVLVPKYANYMGGPINASHSGPYDFLQNVPLLFYGPGFIEARGRTSLPREVTLADVAPTYAELLDFDYRARNGRTLGGILTEAAEPPRLIVTVVIDGGGWNVLEQWPDAWPNLARLMAAGTTIENATVGSSPSVTPAVHTTLSTGTFPRGHGVTGISIRKNNGKIVGAFSRRQRAANAESAKPDSTLKIPTFPDLWDAANGNAPQVGMLVDSNYPLGMLGHGAAHEGGDHDIAIFTSGREWATNPRFFSLPEYVNTEVPGPEMDIEALDRSDGAADGQWRGHDIQPLSATPALAPWQNRTIQAVLDREGFGDDALTDLFFVNYKAPDNAGHQWNMVSPEVGDALASVDTAVGEMITWLDENVGENAYLFVVTADHGQTPIEQEGWAISRAETVNDLNREFDEIRNRRSLVETTSAVSFYLDREEMEANDVGADEIASFLSEYTIRENIPDGAEVPDGFEERLDERVFSAIFPGGELDEIVECTGVGGP